MSENNQTIVSTLMTTIMKARDEALKLVNFYEKKVEYVK